MEEPQPASTLDRRYRGAYAPEQVLLRTRRVQGGVDRGPPSGGLDTGHDRRDQDEGAGQWTRAASRSAAQRAYLPAQSPPVLPGLRRTVARAAGSGQNPF